MMKVPIVTVMELIPFKSPLAHVTSDDEASSDTAQVYSFPAMVAMVTIAEFTTHVGRASH